MSFNILKTGLSFALAIGFSASGAAQSGSTAEALQTGDGNTVTLTQPGTGNQVQTLQLGSNNTVDIEILGSDNIGNTVSQFGDDNSASLLIDGDSNTIDVFQGGVGNNSYTGTISGSANIAVIDQINPTSDAYTNFAVTRQTGTANTASIAQEVVASGSLSGANTVELSQSGNGHIGSVTQSGAENFALLDQTGSNNSGTITQTGVGLSAELIQNGTGLGYDITQTGCVIPGGCDPLQVTQTQGGVVVSGAPAAAGS